MGRMDIPEVDDDDDPWMMLQDHPPDADPAASQLLNRSNRPFATSSHINQRSIRFFFKKIVIRHGLYSLSH